LESLSSVITDRVSGEGNAIGRVRPFSLYLLNQTVRVSSLRLEGQKVMVKGQYSAKYAIREYQFYGGSTRFPL